MLVQNHISIKKAVCFSWFLSMLTLLVFFPAALSAQITGRVVDSEGIALAGVHISALHNGAETTSGADGMFSLTLLAQSVGALVNPAQTLVAPGVNEVRLQRNSENWQLEVHTKSGVFDLQGRLLRGVKRARDSYDWGVVNTLYKTLAQADTLVFDKTGYMRVRVEIIEDDVDLGDVAMESAGGTMTDPRDGKIYRTMGIGDQVWMAQNLAYLPEVNKLNEASYTEPRYYVYGYDSSNVEEAKLHSVTVGEENINAYETYGVLYNWPAVMAGEISSDDNPSGVQGICPEGWHVPSSAEWTELTDFVGATNAGTKLKSTYDWLPDENEGNGNGTDQFGFSVLPAGMNTGGVFYGINYNGGFWTTTMTTSGMTYFRSMNAHSTDIVHNSIPHRLGLSVRCIKTHTPTIRIALHPVSTKYPILGDSVSFTATVNKTSPAQSQPVVTWSVNGGVFSKSGMDFGYTFAESGQHTIIAKTTQNGVSVFDTSYVFVYEDYFIDDRDGSVYPISTIGDQIWMAKNLAYLPEVNAFGGTLSSTKPSYYVYDYNGTDVEEAKIHNSTIDGETYNTYETYGVLYNWPAVMAGEISSEAKPSGVRGICPEGWHVPSSAEWEELIQFVGGSSIAGEKLKSGIGWLNYGNGTNEFGFAAMPSKQFKMEGIWWTSTQSDTTLVSLWAMENSKSSISPSYTSKNVQNSLRCVKN